MQTRDEYLASAKIELGEKEFSRMRNALSNGYYRSIASQASKGISIPKAIYDSLSEGHRYHFDKHFNHRGDRVEGE